MMRIPRYLLPVLVVTIVECILPVYDTAEKNVEIMQGDVKEHAPSPNIEHLILSHQFSQHSREIQMEKLLGRPLFSAQRRPAPIVGVIPDISVPSLPRLTATVVSKNERIAIFVGDNGKNKAVKVGERISAMSVLYIEAEQIALVGPNGPVILRLTPDFARSASTASSIAEKTTMPIAVVGSFDKRAIEPENAHMWGDIANLPKPEPMFIPQHY